MHCYSSNKMGSAPWPMLLATCGYSQDAVACARAYQQLRAEATSQARATATPAASTPAVGQPHTGEAPPAAQQFLSRPPPSGKEIGMQHTLTRAEARALQAHSCEDPQRRAPTASHLLLTSCSLPASEPLLDRIDFEAIAENSVGGNGLPRPPGHFIASRNGDGCALYKRVAQPKTPSHARSRIRQEESKAGSTCSSLQGQGALDQSSRTVAESSSTTVGSMHPVSSQRSVSASNQSKNCRHHFIHPRTKCGRYSLDFGYTHDKQQHDAWATPPEFRRPNTMDRCKANKTQHGLPMRLQLPSATFLAGMPDLPDSAHVRVDCGSTTERAFLQSGNTHGARQHTGKPLVGNGTQAVTSGHDFIMETIITRLGSTHAAQERGATVPNVGGSPWSQPLVPETPAVSITATDTTQPSSAGSQAFADARRRQLPNERALPRKFVPAVGK